MLKIVKSAASMFIGVGKSLLSKVGVNTDPGFLTTEILHIRDGKIIDTRTVHNVVTNTGKAQLAGLALTDVGGTAFDYIAIGTGTTTEAATDTALQTEISSGGGSRTAGTGTRVTTTVTNDTSQLVTTFNFTSSFAVTESGVFNASSSGVMLTRKVFSAINVANGDSIQITWKVQFT